MPSETFNFTGGWVRWVVPEGVDTVFVTLDGGGSGNRTAGRVTGFMAVKGGQVYWVGVGREGKLHSGASGGEACFGGGGRGGDANNGIGGNGGGGASAIRQHDPDGTIRALAAGAGGTSGDGGLGGQGGPASGADGGTGNSGSGDVGPATGGSQIQPGRGGNSSSGGAYRGADAGIGEMGVGGAGGGPNKPNTHGGGGGGGGYRAGGGGQAAAKGVSPGGGGGGGSNFTGGLTGAVSTRGGGGVGNGQVIIAWNGPAAANNPPSPPTNVQINGLDATDDLASKANRQVRVSAEIDDPDAGQPVRLVVRLSSDPSFNPYTTYWSPWRNQGREEGLEVNPVEASVVLTDLTPNTHYYLRLYTEDDDNELSITYTSVDFWTNRPPNDPELLTPDDNTRVDVLDNVTFTWNFTDPDPSSVQNAFEFRYRVAAQPGVRPGQWTTVQRVTSQEEWTLDAGSLKGNSTYDWTVRTRDAEGGWSKWPAPFTLFVTAPATPPLLTYPLNIPLVPSNPIRFNWRFRDASGAVQTHADLRYRVAGTQDWITLFGVVAPGVPGEIGQWDVAADTFQASQRYEWQVRTYSSASEVSDWSESGYFYTIVAAGSGVPAVVTEGRPAAPLGHGHNQVFVYDRGGTVMRGELKYASMTWNRIRDDISNATVTMIGFDAETADFLGSIHTWMHELVIFRDGERVWEGPITTITDKETEFNIVAGDVMRWPYRRILRQGYDDSYQLVNGEQVGLRTVVERATLILQSCLSYDDPNVLPYLTPIRYSTDARESRVVLDYSRTAWEEIDDLAANAGLDYTVVGRRILLWDTHRPIGRLPEMRNGDFSSPPVISEYGMQLANVFGVTDNSGVFGVAERGIEDGEAKFYGYVEMLATAYGVEADAPVSAEVLTEAQRQKLADTFEEQAQRNIAPRWPAPVVVRVPDNSYLSPDLMIGINQLVPGVWIPVRATGVVRSIAQWQKLDSVTVTETAAEGERIAVVMSPAPNQGEDPDAMGVEG